MSFVLSHVEVFSYIVAAALGTVVGSFLNVVILRMRSGVTFVSGSSLCLACGKSLPWYEMIPVVSYIVLRGRCRHCSASLTYQYPLVEAVTAVVFMLVLQRSGILGFPDTGLGIVLGLSLVFWCIAIVIAWYDARHQIIPDELSIALGIVGLGVAFLDLSTPIWFSVSSGLGAAAFFAILWAMSKGAWMGLGDAKLAVGLGIFLGWPMVVLGNLFGFWIGAIWGVAFLLLGKYGRRTEIPFGPFLIIGAFIAYYAGDFLLAWYSALIGL